MFKDTLNKVSRFGRIALIVAIALAFVDTIWAVYIDSFVHSEVIVGLLSASFTGLAIFAYFYLIPFFEKRRKLKLYGTVLILYAVLYILFALNRNLYVFIGLALLLTIGGVIRHVCAGEIVRNQTSIDHIGKSEGLYYVLVNVGWLIGPLIAGFISEAYGLNIIFLLAAIFMLVGFGIFRLIHLDKGPERPNYIHKNFFKNFKDFFKDRERTKTYILSGGVNFWWAILYIYVPLFIINQGGLDMRWVGGYLFAIVIPLVILEYFFGKLVDERGYKNIFIAGFGIMGAASIAIFIANNIFWMIGLLIVASIGAAMVEGTTEAYFFCIITKKKMDKYYSPYNTTVGVSQFVGKVIAAGVLFILPYNYVFLMMGGAMFSYAWLASRLKKNM